MPNEQRRIDHDLAALLVKLFFMGFVLPPFWLALVAIVVDLVEERNEKS